MTKQNNLFLKHLFLNIKDMFFLYYYLYLFLSHLNLLSFLQNNYYLKLMDLLFILKHV